MIILILFLGIRLPLVINQPAATILSSALTVRFVSHSQ